MVGVAERGVALEWDSFLEEETARESIEAFREMQWPNIRRELAAPPYEVTLPDGLEPHWMTPGHAIYWHNVFVLQRMERKDERGDVLKDKHGNVLFERLQVDHGWQPTSPLPANNGGQIAHYLGKGFLLRPPSGVDVEEFEVAVSIEDVQAPPREYACNRHGPEPFRFTTWKGYTRHCDNRGELGEETPPTSLLEERKRHAWFCTLHNTNFKTKRTAEQHIRGFTRGRPGQAPRPHVLIEELEVTDASEG
jgi:desulfoferrodoxin (superoxide reductase-like protein)